MNNDLDRRLLLGTAGLAGIAALAAASKAGGPLDPPAGAVSPTGKTLDQVEPRRIINDVPIVAGARALGGGAWKLTAPLTDSAVLRVSSDVDIDLNGFTLGNGTAVEAITGAGSTQRLRLRNGRVVGPLFASADGPTRSLFEDVLFEGNVRLGNGVVRNCRWGGGTLTVGVDSLIEGCTFTGVASAACSLVVGSGSVIRGVVMNPGATLLDPCIDASSNCVLESVSCACTGPGIRVGANSVLTNCKVSSNDVGIQTTGSAVLTSCLSAQNGLGSSNRFVLAAQCQAVDCIGRGGQSGFVTGEDAVLRDCLAFGGSGAGFACNGAGTSLEGCVARDCTGFGFQLVNSSKIERCLAVANDAGGFRITTDSLARNNHAESNGVVGMLVTGSDNRIDGNSVTDSTTGLQVDVAGNLVIGNSSAGCTTPYAIAAGNAAGPIVLTAGVATNTVTTANFSF